MDDAVASYLAGKPVEGWEALDAAVDGFDGAVAELVSSSAPGVVVVVSHGTVMSAWLAHKVPGIDPVGFWKGLQLPDAWRVDLELGTVERPTEPPST